MVRRRKIGIREISKAAKKKRTKMGNKVFVVHGHDDGAKEAVARLLERLELQPIILHEQPNEGRTIIEKFTAFSDVKFAVVLLTPDDTCFENGKSGSRESRARQNVILELGYFLGKLGRAQVCPLYKGNVVLPSDYSGVVFVPMDDHGAWQTKLATELKAAKLDVDLNKFA